MGKRKERSPLNMRKNRATAFLVRERLNQLPLNACWPGCARVRDSEGAGCDRLPVRGESLLPIHVVCSEQRTSSLSEATQPVEDCKTTRQGQMEASGKR